MTADDAPPQADMSLIDITDGENERKIPIAKFIEDIGSFATSFAPPASAELLIGAYTELYNKYKTYEANLANKHNHIQQKIPELETSLTLIKQLVAKRQEGEKGLLRYSLTDNVFAKAEVEYNGVVNLWLGANVMLEYTYEEAIAFLTTNIDKAQKENKELEADRSFVRDQIVTCEVIRSRIFNWNVRRKRSEKQSTTS